MGKSTKNGINRYWSIAIWISLRTQKNAGEMPWGSAPWEFGTNLQAIAAPKPPTFPGGMRWKLVKTMVFLWFSMIFPSNPWTFIREIWWFFHAFLNMSGAFSMVSWTVKSHVWWFNPHFSVTDYLMIWAANSSLCLCGRRLRGNT